MKKLLILSLILFLGINSVTFAYTDEEKKAYTYAFNKGITTMTTIENANMEGNLTRIAMAKMISNYATNVLKLKLDKTKTCKFADVTEQRDKQYDYGVTHVCQLGLMGIGDDGKIATKFNPEGTLNRAQLVTILSRVLNRANGKEIANGNPYYQTHLDYLNSIGVTNEKSFSAYSNAQRKEVMVLIYRSADEKNRVSTTTNTNTSSSSTNSKVKTVNYKVGYTILKGDESYYNEYYGIGMTHKGNNSWVVETTDSFFTYYSFVPEKYGKYYLDDSYPETSPKYECQNNAKRFNTDGYVLQIESFLILKKGSKDWNDYAENREDNYTPPTSSKGYALYYDTLPMRIQESPYNYNGDVETDFGSYENYLHDSNDSFIKQIGTFESYRK